MEKRTDRRAKRNPWYIVLLLVIAIILCSLLARALVIMALGPSPEKIARSGVPILQAISDYRSDRGRLPERMEDLVPAYLTGVNEHGWKGRWEWQNSIPLGYDTASLTTSLSWHRSLRFYFAGRYTNEWRLKWESGPETKIHVPGPVLRPSALAGSRDVVIEAMP